MMRVSQTALAPFREAGVATWAMETTDFLAKTYGTYFYALGTRTHDLEAMCTTVHRWASRRGCDGNRLLRQLCCLSVSLGHRFWQDPRFGDYVATTVEDRSIPRAKAVAMLIEHGTTWLDALWTDDDIKDFGERLCTLILGHYSVNSETLRYVLPGHGPMFSAEDETRLLVWLGPRLPACQFNHQRLAYTCLALALGTEWWKDPQYRMLAHHVSAQTDPQQLVNRILPMFRAMP
ncbi:hypothetical protein ACERZ8_09685 [Tateyamaria armeniaca]|uniref:Uncharacterized protein n=1 Tax=Tateyamaria armeniaca TaxID=2518930 RepID=A0ABW8UW02_9RHOB